MGSRCEFCGKSFKRESSLESHSCERRRRWEGRREKPFRRGLKWFVRWHRAKKPWRREPGAADFARSPYHNAFVKFGEFAAGKPAVHRRPYFDWLLRNGERVDHWTRETLYRRHLEAKFRTESPWDAAERLVRHLEAWRERNGAERWSDYFDGAPDNMVYSDVKSGTVSPWMFLCVPALKRRVFERMPRALADDMLSGVDVKFWERRISMDRGAAEWIRENMV